MLTININNIKMCELEFMKQKLNVITYHAIKEKENEKDQEYVVSKLFIEGCDRFNLASEIINNEDYTKATRVATLRAIERFWLFNDATKQQLEDFLDEMISKLKSITQNPNQSRKMWGMRGGVINYNNKKYYAITYHTNNDDVKSCLLRDDGVMMEGEDILSFEEAISDAIIRGEKINKNKIESSYCEDLRKEYGEIIDDYNYQEEEKRFENLKSDIQKLKDDISKQMKIVFYAQTFY